MLKTNLAGINLDCLIYNASGPRTGSIEALSKIAKSKAGAVLAKSATLLKQDGNALPRFVNKIDLGDHCQGSFNSEGLPNAGIDYYISSDATSAIHGKPYIVSLSGLSLEDNLEMLGRVYNSEGARDGGIAAIELNLACPNVPGKPIIAYDFEQMELVLDAVTKQPNFHTLPLGVKLAPYFDQPHFERAARLLAQYPVQFVVCCNTIGNALFVDAENECEAIAPKRGLGGLGGGFVKHTALANVRQLRLLLDAEGRSDIDIVGAGGVHCGRDVFELLLCGAKAVQVGTCHWTEGAGCFERIAAELENLMRRKGYSSAEQFRGALKQYIKPTRSEGVATHAAGATAAGATAAGATVAVVSESAAAGSPGMEGSKHQIHALYGIIAALLAVVIALSVQLYEKL